MQLLHCEFHRSFCLPLAIGSPSCMASVATLPGGGGRCLTPPTPVLLHHPRASSFKVHGADFCNCPDDDKAVCGTDQQTYLNECVMRCAGAIKLRVRRHAVAAAGCGLGSHLLAASRGVPERGCECAAPAQLGCGQHGFAHLASSHCNTPCATRPATNPLHQLRWPFCCLAAGRRVQQGLLPARREA